MKRAKKPATRGPRLFGTVNPSFHNHSRTDWRRRRGSAWVADMGPAWSCGVILDGMLSQRGTGFSSRATAQRGLERAIAAAARDCLALGWEPKR